MRLILVRHAMPEVDPDLPPPLWHLGPQGRAAARELSLPPDALLVASTEPKAAETLRAAIPGARALQDARSLQTSTTEDQSLRDTSSPQVATPEGQAPGSASYPQAATPDGQAPGNASSPRTPTPDSQVLGNASSPQAATPDGQAPGDANSSRLASLDGQGGFPHAAPPYGQVLRDAGFDEVRRPHEWREDHRERARAYVEGAAHPGWEPHHQVAVRFDAAIARHAAHARGRPLVVASHGMALTTWLAARHLITTPPGAFWAALTFPDMIDLDLP